MLIELPCYGIRINIEDGGGSITDDLHESIQYDERHPDYAGLEEITSKENFNNLIDGVTSLILAHASAGVNVESPAYIEGIESAVDACSQYA